MTKLTLTKAILYGLGTFLSGFAPVLLTAETTKALVASGLGVLGATCLTLRAFLDKSLAQDREATPEGVPPAK